jgi:hypothetical protein
VLCSVGGIRIAKSAVQRFSDEDSSLGAIEADIARVAPGLLGVERRRNTANANIQDVRVSDARLTVVLGVEVVLEEDRLVIIAASINYDLSEEGDPVATVEVLCLQLLDGIHVDGAIVIAKILALGSPDLAALTRAVLVVCRVLGGDEVEREIACGRASGPQRDAPQGNRSQDEDERRNDKTPASAQTIVGHS